MNELAELSDEALEPTATADVEDHLGDGAKTKGTSWINPDTQP